MASEGRRVESDVELKTTLVTIRVKKTKLDRMGRPRLCALIADFDILAHALQCQQKKLDLVAQSHANTK